ncbi:hypothetical protein JCM11251_003460 [Rhodosporidiobolus azoricus]
MLLINLTLVSLFTCALTALASPIFLSGSRKTTLAERNQYGTPAEVDHFAAVLALQLLAREATATQRTKNKECGTECGAWLTAVEPCSRDNETTAFACACAPDTLDFLEGCASCLGGGAEVQARVFANTCPSSIATNNSITTHQGGSLPSPPHWAANTSTLSSSSLTATLSAASTAPSSSTTSGSPTLVAGRAAVAVAAASAFVDLVTLLTL